MLLKKFGVILRIFPTILLLIRLEVNGQFSQGRDSRGWIPNRVQPDRGDQPPNLDDEYIDGDQDIHPFAEVFKIRHFGYNNNQGYTPAKLHPCEQSSCYPATGNLLIGREAQLKASSTCGTNGRQRYCIVSHLQDAKKCFWCDSTPSAKPNPLLNHNISNIVYRLYPGTRQKSWWQSENGKENVYIQLDLEAEFHFTHLIITFKTFRPASMLIERSYDFGKSWQVYRYFAHNCKERFPGVKTNYPENLTDVVCESRYSNVAPSTNGEIIYRVLPPTLHIDNPYSTEVQNLLKMTNLRINFTKLHTLGDDLLDRRQDIQEKYYYAIVDMVVRGSCSCYGHANRCLPLPGIEPKPDMVHGRCECTHNTKGRNCEKCEDFFNDLPWRPAIGKQTNACKKCNCNNHATSCRFSSALYESSGRISGGVCDGCKHNTVGSNCDQCAMFYYKDPDRDIQDPEICRPCDCDPQGSLNQGICDAETNEVHGMIAGRCHCKDNVEGRRCDTCTNGYWNFTTNGCQACECFLLGTVLNQGCNMLTGECTCKRYVTGRDCNQCLPQYYGISERPEGCQPCDCDIGGTEDNFCDVLSGQCKCKPNMSGRRCDIAKQFYFTASLDFLLYEAELGRASPNSQVVIREPSRDGTKDTWTGTGFLKAFENSSLELTANNIRKTTGYNAEIRYEPSAGDNLENALFTLIRPGPPDPNGICAKSPISETRNVVLPPSSRSVLVIPQFCLEAGVTYIIHLEFNNYDYIKPVSPTASILIDSVVFLPSIDNIPWFNISTPGGLRMREEYEMNLCDQPQYYMDPSQAPEICKHMYNSIGADIFNGAFSCDCDKTGSSSSECSGYGGHCICKSNVVGRRCDRCAPGTFGFSPDGCKACDCDSYGALDNYCNSTTGQCTCRANTYGRQCNNCQKGFWNFPTCRRCDCSGHADECESKTGECIQCKDNTDGANCDRCKAGYYGDPRLSVNIPCRPCPCPGLPNSTNSFADSCTMDPYTKDAICDCKEAYSGSRCDICSDNYFGNPEMEQGSCNACECNGKVDLLRAGNCDPHTGQCKQCLDNTTGNHCEVCREDYFRVTEDSLCEECHCHALGTNRTSGPCNPESGQCPCLPNVTGLNCSSCTANHWKIASGYGCESCDCDPVGAVQPQCHEYNGNCQCRPEFGGRQCNECTEYSWGDPKVKCTKCDCDPQGSETLQCDSKTGACKCRPGIGGYRCDTCDRGYLGESPSCSSCGECFNNWDRILEESKNTTIALIKRAGEIKTGGARGAYTKEFDEMQSQLDDIEQLLNNTDNINTDRITAELNALTKSINETEQTKLKYLDEKLATTKENVLITEIKINGFKDRIDQLNSKIKDLENNGTQLQEDNVQGALTLIQNAKVKADEAAHRAENTEKTFLETERDFQAVQNLLANNKEHYDTLIEANKMKFAAIANDADRLSKEFPELNNLVCDKNGDPCDSICGGAGCNSCGNSISCEDGAKQQAETALSLANSSEIALRNKESLANDFIRNVSKIDIKDTKNAAQAAFNEIQKIFKRLNTTTNDISGLEKKMESFLNKNNTNPDEIIEMCKKILDKKIDSLSTDEIRTLAKEIKEKVESLTNTEAIIDATKEHLVAVNRLKDEAATAKSNATKLSSDVENVKKSLDNSTTAQTNAEKSITDALYYTQNVDELLLTIKQNTDQARDKINETSLDMEHLEAQLNELQQNITNNGLYANRLKNETDSIFKNAETAYGNYNLLETKYDVAKTKLGTNMDNVNSLKGRANELFDKVVALLAKVTKTEEEIHKLESESQQDPSLLESQLDMLIRRAADSTAQIEIRIKQYKDCNN